AVGHSQGIAIATALSMLSDDQSLYDVGVKILGLLLLIGALPQIQHPKYRVIDNNTDMTTQQSVDATPRPMVYVRGLEKSALETVLVEFNDSQQSDSEQVHLAVINSYDQFVVAGTVMSAAKLVSLLRSRSADPSLDQSKVPFSQRKPVITASYVDITVPYHSNLLCLITHAIYNVAQEKGWVLDTQSMQLPVRACDDGHDICSEEDVTRYIIASICVLPVNWPRAIAAPDVTHIVDFGTGGFGGFGQLAFKNVEGRGIPVICAGALLPQSTNSSLGTKADLYQPKMVDVITAPNWLAECGPQLVRTAHDDKVHIDTRMRRVLGMPTVMVAGMTPTTVNEQFVAAVNNAGYHAEIAGGGMHTEGEMADKLQTLSTSIGSGIGITLNCIYINPRQWGFQFPALLRMRDEGVPIAGLCIGGGVPSLDQALEIIDSLRAADIRHVSFKPSTAEAIRHVVRVAQASRGYPIVLQWTGGRGGGHHSYEDFHQPILETYAAIRACDNIALVAGSGFGDAEGSLPYVTGDWSIAYGRAPMPFDGILLGSRVMVAQEAGTSLAAKQLIVATAGLLDSEWDQTYDGAHNGVTTITSEYGEMNHMIATRGVMFIREMFDTILNQPREKREALLLARKDEIISRLNNDYMRPWFGQKTDGRVVDLEEMTYTEVISRAVELMYVAHQQRWTDASFCKFVIDFVDRVERRMCITAPETPISAELFDVDPREYATRVSERYTKSVSQLLTSEDVQFFISMCKRRGQKPPPFIPVLDVDFGVLFMKDMTWQPDDLDSVIDQDPQRVCIQQGPVAVQYSTVVDEPVKDILDGIYHGHITSLVQRLHDGDESQIPVVEYIGAEPVPMSLSESVDVCESETERVFVLPTQAERLPELDAWLQMLAGPHKSWLHALVTASAIVQDAKYADNYIRKLLRARPGRTATVHLESGLPSLLTIVDADGVLELTINCDADRAVRLTIYHKSLYGVVVPFSLEFTYNPSQNLTPIHGSKQRDDESVRKLCIDTWVANAGVPTVFEDVVDSNTVVKSSLTITEEHSRVAVYIC
ncbi:fatty acid synthase alpha subunit Lsd1, partial [Coemansia sp. RSA 521]